MTRATRAGERIPLNTWAIPFGLAGLAETWTAVGRTLDWPRWPTDLLWAVAAAAWVWMLLAHLHRGIVTGRSLTEQLRHPVQGPIAALVPVVAILLGVAIAPYSTSTSHVVVAVAIATTTLFAGWFVGRVLTGGIPVDAVHGGYFLPTVAGGYLAAYAAALAGWRTLAMGDLTLGTLGWIITLAVLTSRLATRPPLPEPLVPTLAIIMAPPAVGGLAWFALNPGEIDGVQAGLGVVLVVMLLAQAVLVPRYVRLKFSLGFWSFTFSFAAVTTYGVDWIDATDLEPRTALVLALGSVTAILVLAIAARSLLALRHAPRGTGTTVVETALERADELAGR
ncbi:transporter [Cellulosimicrobium cellulans]|uniref:SLAC1 family transporter n=1 Tax=Cellulosimicrobium cellulans TaxID=1710 RepID=UPI003805C649